MLPFCLSNRTKPEFNISQNVANLREKNNNQETINLVICYIDILHLCQIICTKTGSI